MKKIITVVFICISIFIVYSFSGCASVEPVAEEPVAEGKVTHIGQ